MNPVKGLIRVVVSIFVEHPAFGIILAFLFGTLIFALLGIAGWAIACFVAAVISAVIGLILYSNQNN